MGFFNTKIKASEENFFAIDLAELSIKVFQVEKSGSMCRVRSYASLAIPEGYIMDGRIMEKEKVAQIIKQIVKNTKPKKINTRKVVCSIAESKAFLRSISIPKMAEEEAREAVKWEMEASIPLTSDQVYFDWQFLSENNGRQNVLTVAVAKEVIDEIMEVLISAGLDPYGLEVESIACVRSLVSCDSLQSDTSLIIDLGAKRTSFIITEGCIPYFTSSIPFSSEAISDVISKGLGINKDEADRIKLAQGIEYMSGGSIFPAVKPLLENLASEIEKSIDFYQNISKEPRDIDKIILSGGGANLKGLVPYLTNRLKRDVFVGDPWININLGHNLPPISREDSVSYTTAIGLALKRI